MDGEGNLSGQAVAVVREAGAQALIRAGEARPNADGDGVRGERGASKSLTATMGVARHEFSRQPHAGKSFAAAFEVDREEAVAAGDR